MIGLNSLKTRFISFALLMFMSASLAGCDSVLAIPAGASDDAPLEVKNDAVYLLKPGDVIKLTVYGDDVLTDEYTINQRGFITVPLINNVEASGLSKEALQKNIAATLVKGGYLSKPLVTVDIVTVQPFYILGEVKNPGNYPWRPSLNVFQAIATAGGYTPRAAKGKILIDREDGTTIQHLNATENTPVLPGDSITVRERIF